MVRWPSWCYRVTSFVGAVGGVMIIYTIWCCRSKSAGAAGPKAAPGCRCCYRIACCWSTICWGTCFFEAGFPRIERSLRIEEAFFDGGTSFLRFLPTVGVGSVLEESSDGTVSSLSDVVRSVFSCCSSRFNRENRSRVTFSSRR